MKLALLLTLFCLSSLAYAIEPLVIGVFPRYPATKTEQMYQPMVAELSQQLSRPVNLVTPPDFAAFWRQVQDNNFDLVHYNQYHYVKAAKLFGHRVLVRNEENGSSEIAAAIVVPHNSPLTRIEQLRDHKILFGGGRGAMVSYIMATDLLRQAGLAEGDYVVQIALNPIGAVRALYYHQGDAASASDAIMRMQGMPWGNSDKKLRVLARSPALAHLPWAVSTRVNHQQAQVIRDALLGLKHTPAGRKALRSARLSDLVETSDQDYAPHRKIIARVLGETY